MICSAVSQWQCYRSSPQNPNLSFRPFGRFILNFQKNIIFFIFLGFGVSPVVFVVLSQRRREIPNRAAFYTGRATSWLPSAIKPRRPERAIFAHFGGRWWEKGRPANEKSILKFHSRLSANQSNMAELGRLTRPNRFPTALCPIYVSDVCNHLRLRSLNLINFEALFCLKMVPELYFRQMT